MKDLFGDALFTDMKRDKLCLEKSLAPWRDSNPQTPDSEACTAEFLRHWFEEENNLKPTGLGNL